MYKESSQPIMLQKIEYNGEPALTAEHEKLGVRSLNQETGQEVVASNPHTFFFTRFEYWVFITLGFSAFILVQSLSSQLHLRTVMKSKSNN